MKGVIEKEGIFMKQRYSSTDQNPLEHILLSTGNVNRSYLVRDLVFATDEKKIHLFASDTDTDTLFQDIIIKLKEKAHEYGADAIINCHFSYEQVGTKEAASLQIFAYGTIVQFKPATIGG